MMPIKVKSSTTFFVHCPTGYNSTNNSLSDNTRTMNATSDLHVVNIMGIPHCFPVANYAPRSSFAEYYGLSDDRISKIKKLTAQLNRAKVLKNKHLQQELEKEIRKVGL